MARIEGKFVWFEVMSKDPKKAHAFYADLFGWGTQQMPMPQGTYTSFTVGDRPIGGVLPAENGNTGWISYLSTDNLDLAVRASEKKGGKLLGAAYQIPGVGQMAKIAEPTGAPFVLFQAEGDDPPDDIEPQEGDIHWNELCSQDQTTSAKFFKDAFGYSLETMPMPAGDYVVLNTGEVGRGGVAQIPEEKGPSHFLQYVRVDDCDATVKKAKKLGGKTLGDPVSVDGVGRFSVIEDPTGTRIGVITPDAR